MADAAVAGGLRLGIAARPRPGQTVSGDLAVVEHVPGGFVLAVVDGAGHGPAAHRAAAAAEAVVRRSREQDLRILMEHCHHALQGTRGAAVTLALLQPERRALTWLGVGTVEGRLVGVRRWPPATHAALRLESGTPGLELPALVTTSMPLEHGDLVVLATDGLRPQFADDLDPRGSPQDVAERILAEHGRPTDDALVLVARHVDARP